MLLTIGALLLAWIDVSGTHLHEKFQGHAAVTLFAQRKYAIRVRVVAAATSELRDRDMAARLSVMNCEVLYAAYLDRIILG